MCKCNPEVCISGLKLKILFRKHGYTPHYAEHIIDPIDGREKLVLADPHIRRSVIIYDCLKKEIEWEYEVPGRLITANPHTAHMIIEDTPDIKAEAGDIICADRDNNYIVVDRDTKRVKWSFKPDDAEWSHDIILSKDGKGIVITDYIKGIKKIRFDKSIVWAHHLIKSAKVSIIEGPTPSGIHSNSFGGDYLLAVNEQDAGVYEIRDSDGKIVWQCPPPKGSINAFWTFAPHSAFRLGMAELNGNLTVIGFEAGGGIVAVDRNCRPRWGIMKPYRRGFYRPTSFGLMETTHVFPTLNGTIGLIDWNEKYSSTVYELVEIPYHGTLSWPLAWDTETEDEMTYIDPPLEVVEWNEVLLQLINVGTNPLDWEVWSTTSPLLITDEFPRYWVREHLNTVSADSSDEFHLTKPRTALRIGVKNTFINASTNYRLIAILRR